MKRFIFFALVCLLCSAALVPASFAQDSTIVYPNYVVIGAFAIHDNAVEFSDDAKKNRFSAKFEMNPTRNLYYVYVQTTDDRTSAFEQARKLRKETKYFDTWVYSGPLGENRGQIVYRSGASQDFNPETGAALEAVNTDRPTDNHQRFTDNSTGKETNQSKTNNAASSTVQENNKGTKKRKSAAKNQRPVEEQSAIAGTQAQEPRGVNEQSVKREEPGQKSSVETGQVSSDKAESAPVNEQPGLRVTQGVDENRVGYNAPLLDTSTLTETGRKAIEENMEKRATLGPPPERATSQPLTSEAVSGKDFYFYLFRADNLATVDGEVDAIDFEKARRMATYQGNSPVKVIMPSGKSKQISFVCQVFGYRKQQREYDPASPSDDLYLDKKGNLVVPFELARLQKGDIAIMYNVFFFKDAAVMRPESRFEVNNLLEFLVENPSYNIMIHGHTNGNATGKIIRMDVPGNFYSLSGTKQGFGSAKQLSEERANVIREFLIASGISPDRMDIRAWGGKKPIHDKHSVRANENVRVEIEILSK